MADKRNILIIHADQHRYDCIGAYGNPDIRTPNIDMLSAAGLAPPGTMSGMDLTDESNNANYVLAETGTEFMVRSKTRKQILQPGEIVTTTSINGREVARSQRVRSDPIVFAIVGALPLVFARVFYRGHNGCRVAWSDFSDHPDIIGVRFGWRRAMTHWSTVATEILLVPAAYVIPLLMWLSLSS